MGYSRMGFYGEFFPNGDCDGLCNVDELTDITVMCSFVIPIKVVEDER